MLWYMIAVNKSESLPLTRKVVPCYIFYSELSMIAVPLTRKNGEAHCLCTRRRDLSPHWLTGFDRVGVRVRVIDVCKEMCMSTCS